MVHFQISIDLNSSSGSCKKHLVAGRGARGRACGRTAVAEWRVVMCGAHLYTFISCMELIKRGCVITH